MQVQQFNQQGCHGAQFPAVNGCWLPTPSPRWRLPYLQDAVSGLQAAVFDCRAARQDVLHQDWPWPVDRGVPGYDGEAQTLCACGNKPTCVTVCNRDINPLELYVSNLI